MPQFPSGAALKGARNSIEAHKRHAREDYAPIFALMTDLRQRGQSLAAIAAELNRRGLKTRQGFPWNPTQVGRVLKLAERMKAEAASAEGALTPV